MFSRERLCAFVEHTERLYGASVAALLREPPFQLSPRLAVHRPSHSGDLQWFMSLLTCWFIDCVVAFRLMLYFKVRELKKIPAYRRPVYDSKSHNKTSNCLVVHVFRRVLYLLAIGMRQRLIPLSKMDMDPRYLSVCLT